MAFAPSLLVSAQSSFHILSGPNSCLELYLITLTFVLPTLCTDSRTV